MISFKELGQHQFQKSKLPRRVFEKGCKGLSLSLLEQEYLICFMTSIYNQFGIGCLSEECLNLLKPIFSSETKIEECTLRSWFFTVRQEAGISQYDHLLNLDDYFLKRLCQKILVVEPERQEEQGLSFIKSDLISLSQKLLLSDHRDDFTAIKENLSPKFLKHFYKELFSAKENPILILLWRVEQFLLKQSLEFHPDDSLLLIETSMTEHRFKKLIGLSFLFLGEEEPPLNIKQILKIRDQLKQSAELRLFELNLSTKTEIEELLEDGVKLHIFFKLTSPRKETFGLKKEILDAIYPYRNLVFEKDRNEEQISFL